MTPEQLIIKLDPYCFSERAAEDCLRIILKAIQDGEVVELCDCVRHALATGIDISHTCCNGKLIILKPDFQKFMEECK